MTSQHLQDLIAKAETGEDWAEICRLEAEQAGGPFYCPTCGFEMPKRPCTYEKCPVQS